MPGESGGRASSGKTVSKDQIILSYPHLSFLILWSQAVPDLYCNYTSRNTRKGFCQLHIRKKCGRIRIGLASVICPSSDQSLWSECEALWLALP